MSVPNLQIWQYGITRKDGISTDVDADYGYFEVDAYKGGDKYTVKAGNNYSIGVPMASRRVGKSYSSIQVRDGRILLGEISSWVRV